MTDDIEGMDIAGVDKHGVKFCELATLSNTIILSCA